MNDPASVKFVLDAADLVISQKRLGTVLMQDLCVMAYNLVQLQQYPEDFFTELKDAVQKDFEGAFHSTTALAGLFLASLLQRTIIGLVVPRC